MSQVRIGPEFTVTRDPIAVAARLVELDCLQSVIESVAMAGVEIIRARTDFNPKSSRGIVLWDGMTRVFREKRRVADWDPATSTVGKSPYIPTERWRSPSLKRSCLTTLPRYSTYGKRRSRRRLSCKTIHCMTMSFSDMPDADEWREILRDESERFETRLILIDFTEQAKGVARREFALPLRANNAGRVTAWGERIAFTIKMEDRPKPKWNTFAEIEVPVEEAV